MTRRVGSKGRRRIPTHKPQTVVSPSGVWKKEGTGGFSREEETCVWPTAVRILKNFCWICSTRAFCTLTPLLFPCPACRWRGEAVGSGHGGRIPGGRLERARARYGTRVITPAAACCGRKQARGDLLWVPMPAVDGLLDGRVRNKLVGEAAPPPARPRRLLGCSDVQRKQGSSQPIAPIR